MNITQEIAITAIKEALSSQPTRTHLSVMDVHQFIPRNQGIVIPARSTVVAEAIVAMFPHAEDIGGGVYELNQVAEEDEAESLFGAADVQWTASNGSQIRVWSGPTRNLYHVAVDAKLYCGVRFSPVPQSQAALAAKAGVVCKLGPVGLNAERKLACQRIDRSGLKSQPVG